MNDPAPGLVLALDQGGHGSRAVIFDESGDEVSAAHVPVATRTVAPDRVEQNALELVRSLRLAGRDACEAVAAGGRAIVTAGLATQRSTIVCFERSTGQPLTEAISWQDRRNAAWLERLRTHEAKVRSLTGLVLSAHYGASKIRWCLDHLPGVQRAAREGSLVAGPLSSFLLHRLLEERPVLADPANASRTLLFDPHALDWSPYLLETFGLERRWLPDCVPTRFAYGHLRLDAREIPLAACTGDQSAAAFAFGRPEPDTALVNVGTGAFVQRAAPAGATLPEGLLRSVLRSSGKEITESHEGTVNGAGSALDWLQGRLALDVDRTLPALSLDPPTDVPLFMNGVGGLGAPCWKADFPVEFVGTGDERQQLAAVVESIAFLLCANLEAMGRAGPLRRIRITGGLARCDYLCQALSTTSGLAVDRHALREATARGVAFLAAGEPDSWRHPPVERAFTPASSESLTSRRARWRAEMARRGAALSLAAATVLTALLAAPSTRAQSIEPRAYANAPVDVNFLVAGPAYATGGFSIDPSLPLEDPELETSYAILGYARSTDFWGRSGKFDVVVPYTWLNGSATIDDEPVHRRVRGFADPSLRVSINLLGAPALSMKDFASYRQDLIVGASLQVTAPWGQYDEKRRVNIGANRWSFRPGLGVSKALGRWTLEGIAAMTLYADNDDYFRGRTRSQEPLYSLQWSTIHNFPRGVWASLDVNYYTGGSTEIDGVPKHDLQRNWRMGGTCSLPIDRRNSIKLYASSGVSARTGNNFDLFGLAWQYRWGGGL